MKRVKLIRITTVAISLEKLIAGQMNFMGAHGFEVTMISSDFESKEELEIKENAKFIPVRLTRKISPFADLKSLYQLVKVFKKLKPQIVHTHTPKAGLIGMLASWLVGVPVRLHTVAGLPLMETNGIKRKILELVEQLTYACATKVYPNSKNLEAFILNEGFAATTKLKVIGNGSSNGIDTDTFQKTTAVMQKAKELALTYEITTENFVFVFVGRLVRDKGVEELVAAFDELSKTHQHVRLLLVGPEEKELDPLSVQCLEKIKQNKAIIAVGYQNDVRPYLALSNVFVLPSYREGFPNAPMQAGCFELPCIVTNINGCNEIIVDEENGLIIPVKDSLALQATMGKLYVDKVLYQTMASKARVMIVERYEQQKVWKLILAEYQEYLNKKGILQ